MEDKCECKPDCCLGEGDPPNRCEHCVTIDGELPCPVADDDRLPRIRKTIENLIDELPGKGVSDSVKVMADALRDIASIVEE